MPARDAEPTPLPAPTPLPGRAATRQAWVDRLRRFTTARLTVAAFCAAEGVSPPAFYAWKRRLALEVEWTAADRPGPAAELPLLPVRLGAAGAAVELVLPTGAVLRIPPGTDLGFVRALVATLGGDRC